jgi:uncharacterized membrane protein YkvA (DUF1232 family)
VEISANARSNEFSNTGFWNKLFKFAKSAGKEVVEKALLLYFALQAPGTPAWAKTVIIGALGYFISPIDAIPDLTPVIGYSDDLGVLAMALAAVATHITAEIKAKAAAKLADWFG